MQVRVDSASLNRISAIGSVGQTHGRAHTRASKETRQKRGEDHQEQTELVPVDAHQEDRDQHQQRVDELQDHDV